MHHHFKAAHFFLVDLGGHNRFYLLNCIRFVKAQHVKVFHHIQKLCADPDNIFFFFNPVLIVNIRVKKIICGYSRKMVPCEVVARNLYFQMAGLLQRGGTDIAQGSDQEFMDLQTLFFEIGHLAQRIRRESAKDMFLRISNRGKVPCSRDQFPVIIPFAVVFGPMEVKEVLQEL